MCGILGLISKETDKDKFINAINLMEHRGPDDYGVYFGSYFDDDIALGHRRLSIIDLSKNARQPMWNESETICIVYNGEIYNFKQLRKELSETYHHQYISDSDTEVLIHAYEEWGVDFIKKLDGMFAFAIWDSKKGELLLARDRAGIKPLYYYKDKDKIIFSSEIAPFFELGVEPEVNKKILYDYFNYQIQIGDETLFKDIKIFPQGNYAIIKNGNFIDFQKYWCPEYTETTIIKRQEGSNPSSKQLISWSEPNTLGYVLEESIKRQLVADVPVGTFLSGGLDSSVITALAKKHYQGDLHTFTVGFDVDKSEIENAEFIAKELGTIQHSLVITAKQFVEEIPKLIKIYGAPISFASSVPLYLLAQEAKKHVKVVLTGEGADELFAGYHRYSLIQQTLSIHEKIKWTRGSIAYAAAKSVFKDPRYLKNLDFMFNGMNLDYLTGINSIIGDERNKLLNHENIPQVPKLSYEVSRLFDEKGTSEQEISFTNRLLYLDFNTYLQELLAKQDRMSMAASIESRVPFLGNEVIDFANSISSNFKLNGKTGKYLLKETAKGILPEKVCNMKKIGFTVPLDKWFKEDLADYLEQQLSDSRLDEYFNRDYINKLLKKQKKNNCSLQLWTILNFKLWLEQFIWEREERDNV